MHLQVVDHVFQEVLPMIVTCKIYHNFACRSIDDVKITDYRVFVSLVVFYLQFVSGARANVFVGFACFAALCIESY